MRFPPLPEFKSPNFPFWMPGVPEIAPKPAFVVAEMDCKVLTWLFAGTLVTEFAGREPFEAPALDLLRL